MEMDGTTMKTILTTQRLSLRELSEGDRADFDAIFRDPETIYAYGYLFSPEELDAWFERQTGHQARHGYGLWTTVERLSGAPIGFCGIVRRNIENAEELEISYFVKKRFRHRGYANEAAAACRDYAFNALGAKRVVACVRVDNAPSRRVAESLGMTVERIFVRHCSGEDIPYALYVLELPGIRK